MNIKKEYIDLIKEYLVDLRSDLNRINRLNAEIKELKLSDNAYHDFSFTFLDIKSQSSAKGIDDMIISKEQLIYIKECEIIHINKKYNDLNNFLDNLMNDEDSVIRIRYFSRVKTKNNKKIIYKKSTVKEVADKLKYSVATIKRKEYKALSEIAYWKYGNISLELEKIC